MLNQEHKDIPPFDDLFINGTHLVAQVNNIFRSHSLGMLATLNFPKELFYLILDRPTRILVYLPNKQLLLDEIILGSDQELITRVQNKLSILFPAK